ncbi:DUF2292 domain-containing protein [Paenibacillus pinisoli]|uniref:DUF2292 domain-containing protein n=1 Tax=Paenibacillus pinisoli TaxID=1276110 RepID=A0A3A6PGV3_9BACL|nr:YezD family protein [Paenibacillus pinisoli]RJX39480.1 DUF2292 domain-containing protein [Paenibacillus pinisoli]
MGRTVEVNDVWLKRIIGQVQGLAYGTVQITVHDGQIVQIDRTERSRFDVLKSKDGGRKR